MKRIVYLLGLLTCSINISAQSISSDFVSESKANKFQESKGLFLKVERFESSYITGFSTFRTTPVIITDIRTGEKEGYIEFWFNNDSGYTSSLDYDEIPACIEALDYIINNELSKTPSNDVSVFLKTRDGIRIGAFYDEDGKKSRWYTSLWQTKYLSKPNIKYDINQLEEIRKQLMTESELLKSKLQ